MTTNTNTRKPDTTPYVVHGVAFESHAAYIVSRRRYRRALRSAMKSAQRSERS